jgi:hypothetical protein
MDFRVCSNTAYDGGRLGVSDRRNRNEHTLRVIFDGFSGVVGWLTSALPRKRPSLASQERCVWLDAHDSNSQNLETLIMPYELADYEWATIKPMLPNKPRGVPRVNDRRVLNGIFWVLR